VGETTVTIIVVLHCHEPDLERGTVWLVPGEYTPDDPMPDEDDRPVKIVGPVPTWIWYSIQLGLKRTFESMGLRVIEHTWPDD
jgi:hypothetical protein